MTGAAAQFEFRVLTLFPDAIAPVASSSILGRAQSTNRIRVEAIDIRDFAVDRHRTADDTPFGGGEGMVLKPDVLLRAWEHARRDEDPARPYLTVFLTPQGRPLTQEGARALLQGAPAPGGMILVCGHYEGVDERFVERCVQAEVSIGDYVLTGGELPALVLIDVVSRLLPGVVGKSESVTQDTFSHGLLKHPQFTRPRDFEGRPVPEVLVGGDHGAISAWRRAQSEARTRARRPDLWQAHLSRIAGSRKPE